MAVAKSMAVTIRRGELIPPEAERVKREDIGPGGARGLWDGFGQMTVAVGETTLAVIRIREDGRGHVVLDITSEITEETMHVPIEDLGLIAPDSTSRDRGWIKEGS